MSGWHDVEVEDRPYKWEISPHPDTSDVDICVTDDDEEALQAFQRAAEKVWDQMEPGEECTITIKYNAVPTSESTS